MKILRTVLACTGLLGCALALADGVSGTVTITSATITNALGFTPVSQALSSGHVFVGNGSNVAADNALTGACTITNAGVINCPLSVGTVPVGTTGSCSASGMTGGAYAGKFTAPACAAGTIILSSLPTATNGWSCTAQDQTTSADTLKQTANTTTSVTFTATTANSDVVVFQCQGW